MQRPREWSRRRSLNRAANGPGRLVRDLLFSTESDTSAFPSFEESNGSWKLYAAWAAEHIGLVLSEESDEDDERAESEGSEASADNESDTDVRTDHIKRRVEDRKPVYQP